MRGQRSAHKPGGSSTEPAIHLPPRGIHHSRMLGEAQIIIRGKIHKLPAAAPYARTTRAPYRPQVPEQASRYKPVDLAAKKTLEFPHPREIKAHISLTACPSPTRIARETIAWPMFNSSSDGSASTGPMLT